LKRLKTFFTRLWFNHQLNKDKIIKVDDRHRGVGKTTMLLKRARKENLPIVVGNQGMVRVIRDLSNHKADIIRLAPNLTIDIKGTQHKYPNGVLIDNSVDPMMIAELHNNGFVIRGGFINSEFVARKNN
jgi:hypothetical protein